MPHYTAIVSLLAIAFYFFVSTRVAAARGRFGVKLPATTGHPDFERIFRVQMNTLEWMPVLLVPLWLCALYLSDIGAALLGLVWIAGRLKAVAAAGFLGGGPDVDRIGSDARRRAPMRVGLISAPEMR